MISVCITTFNRTDLLFESFAQIENDERVSEIVIVDDHSTLDIQWILADRLKGPKFKFITNERNLGCYANKREAVSRASSEWVILFDSDNILTPQYIDRIENLMIAGVNLKTLYQPEFARPHFNFAEFSGINFTKANVAKHAAHNVTFCTMLNAMNYFVNRDEYLRVWENRLEPWTADSLFQNYNWLNAGNSIYVVPGLEYDHRVHEGSHYKEHFRKTESAGSNGRNLYNEMVSKLKLLS